MKPQDLLQFGADYFNARLALERRKLIVQRKFYWGGCDAPISEDRAGLGAAYQWRPAVRATILEGNEK